MPTLAFNLALSKEMRAQVALKDFNIERESEVDSERN